MKKKKVQNKVETRRCVKGKKYISPEEAEELGISPEWVADFIQSQQAVRTFGREVFSILLGYDGTPKEPVETVVVAGAESTWLYVVNMTPTAIKIPSQPAFVHVVRFSNYSLAEFVDVPFVKFTGPLKKLPGRQDERIYFHRVPVTLFPQMGPYRIREGGVRPVIWVHVGRREFTSNAHLVTMPEKEMPCADFYEDPYLGTGDRRIPIMPTSMLKLLKSSLGDMHLPERANTLEPYVCCHKSGAIELLIANYFSQPVSIEPNLILIQNGKEIDPVFTEQPFDVNKVTSIDATSALHPYVGAILNNSVRVHVVYREPQGLVAVQTQTLYIED